MILEFVHAVGILRAEPINFNQVSFRRAQTTCKTLVLKNDKVLDETPGTVLWATAASHLVRKRGYDCDRGPYVV